MVVVAGMEGALPSVVGGYVACPVIAVPTSVGYGASFGGLAALLGMLNSCAANVTVVNIDAGFKGGYLAGLIATQRGPRHGSGPMSDAAARISLRSCHSRSAGLSRCRALPRRGCPTSHKGDFGTALLVGGRGA